MIDNILNFIQENSPDGGFLQSEEWRKFQETVGRKTLSITGENFNASVVEHSLPLVGKYFYVPRGPVMPISNFQFPISNKILNPNNNFSKQIHDLINLAKKENAGWIRIEPATDEILREIKNNINYKIVKAPHDMQPKEILVMDITKSEEEILAGMKQKTRYNIRLAEKKEVKIIESRKYIDEFVRLTKIMAKRQGITAHPESYYKKMLEAIPEDTLKLYVAEYEGKIIAANLVVFYPHTKAIKENGADCKTTSDQNNNFGVGVHGNACTYLHGASDDDYRNIMAPYLLQWRQIQDAKKNECGKYDFGGISTNYESNTNIRITNKWSGITRFKFGFSPNTKPVEFPGSYDIIITPTIYYIYRIIQKIKSLI